MATYRVTSPDGVAFNVTAPDGASEEAVMRYAQSMWKRAAPKPAAWTPASPTEGMSGFDTVAAGMGKRMTDWGRAAGQMLWISDQGSVDEARKLDAPLMDTFGGKAGAVGADLLSAVIPGTQSVKGAALVSGALGALTPTVGDESRVKNIAVDAALGAGSTAALKGLTGALQSRLASKEAKAAQAITANADRDAAIAAGKAEGFVAPPSISGGGAISRALEGLSGKQKTNQAAALKNQPVTEKLARRAVGLDENAALSPEVLQGIRNEAYQAGYEPVKALGVIPVDPKGAFVKRLDEIASEYTGASKSFPNAIKSEVPQLVEAFKVPAFDAGDAIAATKVLREEASAAFRAGDTGLSKAKREISKALEDQIESHLTALGKDGAEALNNFRDARQLMAKTHSVEKALVAGTNQVDARELGKQLAKGKPLSGDLKTIGAFSQATKGSGLTSSITGVPEAGHSVSFSPLDFFTAGIGTQAPAMLALPVGRAAARAAILSGPVQRSIKPSYGPGLLARKGPEVLSELERWKLGLLAPALYGGQQ